VTFPDFEEFIACLNAHRVRYLIVGGYAVGFHARPRATNDLDVLVDRSAVNAGRVQAALFEFLGSKPAHITLAKLRNPRTLIVLGTTPVRIGHLDLIARSSRLGVPSISAISTRCDGCAGGCEPWSALNRSGARAVSGHHGVVADLQPTSGTRGSRLLGKRRTFVYGNPFQGFVLQPEPHCGSCTSPRRRTSREFRARPEGAQWLRATGC
jgi:hypothetical protein